MLTNDCDEKRWQVKYLFTLFSPNVTQPFEYKLINTQSAKSKATNKINTKTLDEKRKTDKKSGRLKRNGTGITIWT